MLSVRVEWDLGVAQALGALWPRYFAVTVSCSNVEGGTLGRCWDTCQGEPPAHSFDWLSRSFQLPDLANSTNDIYWLPPSRPSSPAHSLFSITGYNVDILRVVAALEQWQALSISGWGGRLWPCQSRFSSPHRSSLCFHLRQYLYFDTASSSNMSHFAVVVFRGVLRVLAVNKVSGVAANTCLQLDYLSRCAVLITRAPSPLHFLSLASPTPG